MKGRMREVVFIYAVFCSFPILCCDRISGGIAQLARASALQAEGQGFESPYLQISHFSVEWNSQERVTLKRRWLLFSLKILFFEKQFVTEQFFNIEAYSQGVSM
jgi:hypothetical protein